jgi:hypothetical protein
MKPTKCRNCGVEEWRHVCAGAVSRSAPSRVNPSEEPARAAAAGAPNVPNSASARTAAWREKNEEKHRDYMRGLMAKRRAARSEMEAKA